MNWKELWEWFIREIIAECRSAIIKWFIWGLIRLITKKILQLLKQNSKELTMKKNVEKIKHDNGRTGKFRVPERGPVSIHSFSCHKDLWQEIGQQRFEKNMSLGQYIDFIHNFYMKNEAKNKTPHWAQTCKPSKLS